MKKLNYLMLVVEYIVIWTGMKLKVIDNNIPMPDFNNQYDETIL